MGVCLPFPVLTLLIQAQPNRSRACPRFYPLEPSQRNPIRMSRSQSFIWSEASYLPFRAPFCGASRPIQLYNNPPVPPPVPLPSLRGFKSF